jgi:uncharacterized protein YjbJ (UPF0337 family)
MQARLVVVLCVMSDIHYLSMSTYGVQAGSTWEKIKKTVTGTAEQAQDTVEDATGTVRRKAGETADEAARQAQGTAEEARRQVGGTWQRIKDTITGRILFMG